MRLKTKRYYRILWWGLFVVSIALLISSIYLSSSISNKSPFIWRLIPVRIESIQEEIDNCYIACLGKKWLSSHKHPSDAQLIEDGIPLKFSNSLHDEIRQKGGGRHSFWYDYVYFSASDNSNPNNNNKIYIIKYPITVLFPVFFTMLLIMIFMIWVYREIFTISFAVVTLLKIFLALFLFGIFLIGINVTGFFIPLRNSDIYKQKTGFENDITLTKDQLYNVINNNNIENKQYIIKLNKAVNDGICHYWLDEGINKYNIRIPIYENYLLFIASYIYPETYKKYEYLNYKKAIERGIGLCSQHAIIISEILKEKGIESKIIALNGHVVAMAKVDKKTNEWWVIDPDMGVVIENDISYIENEPEIIRDYYFKKGFNDKKIDELVEIYGKEGNIVVDSVKDYDLKKYRNEYTLYVLIWLIPLFFMLPYSLLFFFKIFNRLRECNKNWH